MLLCDGDLGASAARLGPLVEAVERGECDLAVAAFGSRLVAPMTTVRGYELPGSLDGARAVLCSSYSGETEETLACYEAAEALGARRLRIKSVAASQERPSIRFRNAQKADAKSATQIT